MKRLSLFLALSTLSGLGLALADQSPSTLAFRFGKKRSVILPVKVGESTQAEFLLDTGLGFNVVSPSLAQKVGVESGSTTKIKPVTGGEFDLPQGRISSLTVGNQSESDQPTLIAEPKMFISNDGENKVDGILSLSFFREHPFTLDYANQKLIFENSDSLAKRKATGHRVECRMADEGIVAAVSLALTERPVEPTKSGLAALIPSFSGPPEPPKAWVQVNTGSEHLMLDSKLMFTLKVDDTGANVTESETTDQNGRRYRSFTSHLGKVELADNPALVVEKQPVVFRKLQTEGVLGQSYLQRYTVTFDLPNSEMIFSKGN